jgi:hypothetical protein
VLSVERERGEERRERSFTQRREGAKKEKKGEIEMVNGSWVG